MSLWAPDVTLSSPKIISSATLPPMQTSNCARYSLRVNESLSMSGSCTVMPSAEPRGMMVALCNGIAPGVKWATRACPPSW
ncbi:hypothetical protein BC936DRAFT_136696 [Jimgerdemannia flammicorona]|uniref:Uncharacterized protein n=1 Tax=Jimgerdemannia flammicorona TaxID=994334 RepID=A0A433CZ07_9FUNG|nr:hypothetical protein BC936DRAFT_136696 [Jimgerdemannia flammicorona]